MPVLDGNEFEGHGGSSVNGIFIATGRTETGFTAERDELEVAQEEQEYMAPPKEGSPQ